MIKKNSRVKGENNFSTIPITIHIVIPIIKQNENGMTINGSKMQVNGFLYIVEQ
jgi:hypothetical protein